jgi:hypothetical protein
MKPEDNEQNAEQCTCPSCPTFNDCMNTSNETLYCARGDSPCEPARVECICGDCPVWESYQLSDFYYCLEGASE